MAICELGLKAKVNRMLKGSEIKKEKLNGSQILTHVRCHMDDARVAVETGVDGV